MFLGGDQRDRDSATAYSKYSTSHLYLCHRVGPDLLLFSVQEWVWRWGRCFWPQRCRVTSCLCTTQRSSKFVSSWNRKQIRAQRHLRLRHCSKRYQLYLTYKLHLMYQLNLTWKIKVAAVAHITLEFLRPTCSLLYEMIFTVINASGRWRLCCWPIWDPSQICSPAVGLKLKESAAILVSTYCCFCICVAVIYSQKHVKTPCRAEFSEIKETALQSFASLVCFRRW